jgi:hypothetical protein
MLGRLICGPFVIRDGFVRVLIVSFLIGACLPFDACGAAADEQTSNDFADLHATTLVFKLLPVFLTERGGTKKIHSSLHGLSSFDFSESCERVQSELKKSALR